MVGFYKTIHALSPSPSIAIFECEGLSNPENGEVSFNRTVPGSVASYSCNVNFTLSGNSYQMCGLNGSWSGEAPVCVGECCHLDIKC